MLFTLQGPLGPLSPKVPGVRGFFGDLKRWLLYDGPNPPKVVHMMPILMIMVHQIPSIWVSLSCFELWTLCRTTIERSIWGIVFCIVLGIVIPKQVAMHIGEWALSEPMYYVIIYGAFAFVLFLKGYPLALLLL